MSLLGKSSYTVQCNACIFVVADTYVSQISKYQVPKYKLLESTSTRSSHIYTCLQPSMHMQVACMYNLYKLVELTVGEADQLLEHTQKYI